MINPARYWKNQDQSGLLIWSSILSRTTANYTNLRIPNTIHFPLYAVDDGGIYIREETIGYHLGGICQNPKLHPIRTEGYVITVKSLSNTKLIPCSHCRASQLKVTPCNTHIPPPPARAFQPPKQNHHQPFYPITSLYFSAFAILCVCSCLPHQNVSSTRVGALSVLLISHFSVSRIVPNTQNTLNKYLLNECTTCFVTESNALTALSSLAFLPQNFCSRRFSAVCINKQ